MHNRKAKKVKNITSFFNLREHTTSQEHHSSDNNDVVPNIQTHSQPQRIEVQLGSFERDPAKRLPIREHPVNQRDEIRRAYIKLGAFQPILNKYKPIFDGKQKRHFQRSWFNQFPWLEYSPTNHSAYCLTCFLFDQENNSHCPFTSTGFNGWKQVNDGKNCSFLKHMGDVDSQHNGAVILMNSLRNPSRHINEVMNPQRPEEIKRNRLRVFASIKSLLYLTLQACALRGHDESPTSKNRGNFIQLIKIFGDLSSEIKDVVLENAPKNAKYTSHHIQLELLVIFAKRVRNTIRGEIGDSKFCILVDEAKDTSNKEQMAIVLRFVDVSGLVKERFFDIVHVKDTCATTLKKEICTVLSEYNLQICNMRGQGYDGTSNMGGARNGLKALFLRDCSYAYHVHCFAHRLQLALVDAAKNLRHIWCFVSNLNKIVNVVSASPKRYTELKSAQAIEIAEMVATGERKTSKGANQMGDLHRPGETRWSSHFDSTCSLIDMFGATLTVLQYMSDECSNDIGGEAYGCRKVMRSFDFVFILHLMNKILGLSVMLCRSLQQKSLDILNAMDLVSTTKEFLQSLRDSGFDCLLTHVVLIKMGTGRSCQQTDFMTVGHHYRVDIFNTAIDTELAEINNRFKDETVQLLKLSDALDPKDNFRLFNEGHIYDLADKFYPNDFTDQEMHHLRLQLEFYKSDICSHESFQYLSTISELSKKLVETNKVQVYTLITRLIHLVMTLPVTTATTERAFSAMKHVKKALRNKMERDFLSNSMVMYIEKDLVEDISIDSVIDEFYNAKDRRMKLM